MPKLKNRYPAMYRDKNSAVSKHKGQRIYHGAWGLPEADKSYKRFLAALLENPTLCLRVGKDADVLVSDSQPHFWKHITCPALDGHFLLHHTFR